MLPLNLDVVTLTESSTACAPPRTDLNNIFALLDPVNEELNLTSEFSGILTNQVGLYNVPVTLYGLVLVTVLVPNESSEAIKKNCPSISGSLPKTLTGDIDKSSLNPGEPEASSLATTFKYSNVCLVMLIDSNLNPGFSPSLDAVEVKSA